MSHWRALSSEYIAAVEFGDRTPTMTIVSVKREQLAVLARPGKDEAGADDDAVTKPRGVVRFKEADRGWVLNRTNSECLAAMWGVETNAWIGKRVTLFAKPVKVGLKTEAGIRVKGSPDLTAALEVEVKLPRRRPETITLVPTGKP